MAQHEPRKVLDDHGYLILHPTRKPVDKVLQHPLFGPVYV